MQTTIQRYMLSSLTTFLTAFLSALALQLSNGDIVLTGAFLFSILSVAARIGVKAVVEGFAKQNADKTV
jgi:hypothetical protein